MKEGGAPGGDLTQHLDTSWLRPPSPPAFPSGRIDIYVLTNRRRRKAPRRARCLPMRSRAPADFISRTTDFTLPGVAPRCAPFLPTTSPSLAARSVSSILTVVSLRSQPARVHACCSST
jgi:hypothetical protein